MSKKLLEPQPLTTVLARVIAGPRSLVRSVNPRDVVGVVVAKANSASTALRNLPPQLPTRMAMKRSTKMRKPTPTRCSARTT